MTKEVTALREKGSKGQIFDNLTFWQFLGLLVNSYWIQISKNIQNFVFISILWHFSQTCNEHVYEKTLQYVVGARFSDHHYILYVTVCMYMNSFATILVFLMWSFKNVFYSWYAYSIFVTIKLYIVNKIDVGISELSLDIYLKKHLRLAETHFVRILNILYVECMFPIFCKIVKIAFLKGLKVKRGTFNSVI